MGKHTSKEIIMNSTGKLTINLNISRLDGTRLMKGAVNNGGFGRATTFLRQDRLLNSGETIWVDGEDDEFQGASVIVIADAGRVGPTLIAAGADEVVIVGDGMSEVEGLTFREQTVATFKIVNDQTLRLSGLAALGLTSSAGPQRIFIKFKSEAKPKEVDIQVVNSIVDTKQ
jgi:hypothetical protein